MKKLFNLKEWLSVEDTARHLSILLDEPVVAADVLRLGLDGQLTISVNLVNHATGKLGRAVSAEEAQMTVSSNMLHEGFKPPFEARHLKMADVPQLPKEVWDRIDSGELMLHPLGDVIHEDYVLEFESGVTTLRGVWDLPMYGGERLDVEHYFQQMTGGPEVTLSNLDGAYVKKQDGTYAKILESYDNNEYQKGSRARLEELKRHISEKDLDAREAQSLLDAHAEDRKQYLDGRSKNPRENDFFPAGGLPTDSTIVVRTDEIRRFVDTLQAPPAHTGKPLKQNERNSLLTVIAALCEHTGIDHQERGVAGKIAAMTEEIGAPVSDDTLRRILGKIPDALESRM